MSRAVRRNKKRQKKFGFSHVIIAIMMIAVVTAAVLFYTDSFGFASSLRELLAVGSQEVVDADGLKIVDGDFTIDAPGDRLEDTHITGNLYLASGIGDGSVDLVNVKVDGSTLIQGGGINSIYMISCTFEELKVNRPEGRVRIVVSGETVIEKTILETGARLIENIKGGSAGFKSVEVMTDQQVDLIGNFDSIHVSVKDANVETTSEMLEQLVITKTAAGTAFKYTDGLFIKNMYLDGTAYLVGRIEVDQAFLAASGITELNGSFNQVRITAEAGQFDIKEESTFNKLIVARDALNNELNLGENVTVASLELNEAVTVKGGGIIEKVLINAPGSSIEQLPLDIEFAQEVSVIIGGYEISSPAMLNSLREHGDPQYVAAAAVTPVKAAPQPAPAPAPEPEPEPAPEPEPEPEPEGSLIKDFIVEDGITPGKKMVIVTLNVSDPQNYLVKVGGAALGYNAQAKSFWGEVDSDDAVLSKAVVSQ